MRRKREIPYNEEQLKTLVDALSLFIAQSGVPVRDVCRDITVKALEASLKRHKSKRAAAENIGMKDSMVSYYIGPKAFPCG